MKKQKGQYHFVECGLPSVFLEGVTWYACSQCKEAVAEIPKMGQLLRCLAWRVVTKTSLLSGKEIVFLRKLLSFSQKQFAGLLGVNQVELSRWETGNRDSRTKANDRLIRMVYLGLQKDEYTQEAHKKLLDLLSICFSKIKSKVTNPEFHINPKSCTSEQEFKRMLAFCTSIDKISERTSGSY